VKATNLQDTAKLTDANKQDAGYAAQQDVTSV